MTNRNYKQLASPSVLEAFYARPNKKDSFERWFKKGILSIQYAH